MRKRRVYSENGFYHTIIRGVNKQIIFFDDFDKKYFLLLLKKFSKKHKIKIHAYCLMDNHVHLLLQDPEKHLSEFMQLLASVYARYFNRKYDRIGHLYQDRFASEVINNNRYMVVVFRYIIQNPQKAGLCDSAYYRWNSYVHYRKKSTFLDKSLLLNMFPNIDELYRYLEQNNEDECLEMSLKPSEKKIFYIEKIKKILKSENPIIPQDLPRNEIFEKIKLLRKSGLSQRLISRVTGISLGIIQRAM